LAIAQPATSTAQSASACCSRTQLRPRRSGWPGESSRPVQLPTRTWLVPLGSALSRFSIAIDTVGSRTIYEQEIQGAEGLVHGITIFCGITSCVLFTTAYPHPRWLWIPALVQTTLAFVYSLVDDAFHSRRYVGKHSYPGVAETLHGLGGST
jgi:hypothetical protein